MTAKDDPFGRWTGWCLVAAGLLFLAVGLLSAGMPLDDSIRRSPWFALRQSLALAIALLLLFGSIGIYARHPRRGGVTMTLLFVLAATGSAFLAGHEWQELFLARDFATRSPDGFARLEGAPGMTPYDVGALIAATTFVLGWIAFAAATVMGGAFSRWAGPLVIAGLFALPVATAVVGPPVGPLIGAAMLAAGFVRLGFDVIGGRPEGGEQETSPS